MIWRLAAHEATAGHQVNQHAKRNEYANKIGSDSRTGLRRKILGEKAVGDARSNEEENSFADKKPQEKANSQQDKALGLTKSSCSLAAIENPNGNKVQDIESGSRTCKSGPEAVTGAIPKRSANGGAEKSGKRTRKADGGASPAGDTESLPAHVSAQAGEEHGHIGGQAAAADINIVAHLVNQNEDGETDTEGGAEERPIDAHESEKTEEEFELKDGQEKSLTFRKENGDGSERAKLAGPGMFLFRRSHLRGEFEFVNLAANPFGLRGV